MTDIFKMIKSNDLLKIALVLLGVYLFLTYKSTGKEGVDNVIDAKLEIKKEDQPKPIGKEQVVTEKKQIDGEDLLPKYDDANEFAKQNPVSKLLKEQNFLISGYHVGINTVMQSNKIPYYDIRSAPPIPKEVVSPWSQSSFEQPAGAGRKQLEVGVI